MHKQRTIVGIGAALLLQAVSAASHAGLIPMMSANTLYYVPSANMSIHMHSIVADSIIRHPAVSARPASEVSGTSEAARHADTAMSFVPSPAVSQEVKRSLVDEVTRARDVEAGRQFEEILARSDVVGDFNRLLARYGYSGTNVADVMTAYFVMSWEVVTGHDATPAQIKGVNRQMRESILTNGHLLRMGDREKQSAAENMIYQVALSSQSKNELVKKRDAARLGALRDGVAASMRELGFDFRTLSLTDRGFVSTVR